MATLNKVGGISLESDNELTDAINTDELLSLVQDRVLWIAMQLVHHANNVRSNPDGTKVGGHQASSSSIVTIMTSLFFDFMTSGDKVSVKPHGSPVYHAIQYLLGNLDAKYLTELRAFHGLQAYPSRTKDPDGVDYSTGSVGIGAVAPNFASIVRAYNRSHQFSNTTQGRYISVLGDAELDEGSIWEAIAEPAMGNESDVLWVVDLNRQSLDRIIPGIRVNAWREMFEANGWTVVEAKYGKKLQRAFDEPRGELLKGSIDDMPNEVYQRLLRIDSSELRQWLPEYSQYPKDMKKLVDRWDDAQLNELFHNLGGHDFSLLRDAFRQADNNEGPNVVFAYTLKGYNLPSVGDPQNHSVTLSYDQMEELRQTLNISGDDQWSVFDTEEPAGQFCMQVADRLKEDGEKSHLPEDLIPRDFGRNYSGLMSSQQIFGLILTDMSRNLGGISDRIVTVSPDVASSTNLGGWINRVGVWGRDKLETLPDEGIVRALRWDESPSGQHIELGISENNLFMMLGQLGLSYEADGEVLFPIGTVYDPFIRRGLDAFVYSVYSGSKFMIIGTPSGLTLAPEGGAHQSMMTPSIGVEMPDLDAYEPAFGQELEWIMLSGIKQIRDRTRSTYLRLTSKRVDQSLLDVPSDPVKKEALRSQVLNGVYCLVDRSLESGFEATNSAVNLFVSGAMVPEACEASGRLLEEGVFVNVLNVTGPGPLFRNYMDMVTESVELGVNLDRNLINLFPGAIRGAPVVTLMDAHPHSLAWIGSALASRTLPLGVKEFGQSGNRDDLYREYGIDVESIMSACMAALDV